MANDGEKSASNAPKPAGPNEPKIQGCTNGTKSKNKAKKQKQKQKAQKQQVEYMKNRHTAEEEASVRRKKKRKSFFCREDQDERPH
ncbi:hypothetical protein IW138_006201 [Coemansia sp. RSA 986]|nr:hypothetical protein IW138_006201 [Coemansia sp. RSA 986]